MTPKPPKDWLFLYHITCIDNLESILIHWILSRAKVATKKFVDVASVEILTERGGLDEFVPFHFFAPTPFAGSIQIDHPDKKFCIITIDRNNARDVGALIIPKHPLHYKWVPLPYDEWYASIDWEIMSSRDYDNHECKETCLAECIIKDSIDIKLIKFIYVRNNDDKKIIDTLLESKGIAIAVSINTAFFC